MDDISDESETWSSLPSRPESTALPRPQVAEHIRELLTLAHKHALRMPIGGADDAGCFPTATFRLFGRAEDALLVTPDTNILGNDIGYSCRRGIRTTLVNGANLGAFRMVCARHVIEEVLEHASAFASRHGVSTEAYTERFCSEYLPLLRVVDHVPLQVLDADERERVRQLEQVDPDDVPSVALSLAVGSFYLSVDRRAVSAVYGADVDLAEHHRWVRTLRAGGDAEALDHFFFGGYLIAWLVAQPVVAGVRGLVRRTTPGTAAIAMGAVGGALIASFRCLPVDRRARTWRALRTSGVWMLHLYAEYLAAVQEFRKMQAPPPDWPLIASTTDATSALTRACLHALACSPESDLSAKELRERLPALPVPAGEAKVREALRGGVPWYFDQPYRGRFQVGRAVPEHLRTALLARASLPD